VQYDATEGSRSIVRPARTGRIIRHRRRFWRWRAWRNKNPLRRPISPLERLVVVGTAALGTALVALTVTAALLSLSAAERAVRGTHVVNATVTVTDASNSPEIRPEIAPGSYVAHLHWKWQGTDQGVDIPVLTPPPPGSTVQVRVNNSGLAVDNPWSPNDPVPVVLETALSGLVFSATIMLGVVALVRQWIFRRRAALWESEWEQVSSLWCGRGN
jgi:hypothetical protein